MAHPVRDPRAGFTLVELLIALVISGLLVGVVFQLMQGQARFVGMQSSREEVQQNARAAIEMIGSELRSVPPQVGLVGAWEDSVRVRVPRVWGVICGVAGSQVSLRLPAATGVSYDPTLGTAFAADVGAAVNRWTSPVGVSAVGAPSASECGGPSPGSEVRRVTLSAAARTIDNVAAAPGDPAYVYDLVTYRVGESEDLGGWWIERRSGGNGAQPLAGPLLTDEDGVASGLRFRFFAGDAELAVPVAAAQLASVTRVEVVVGTVSRNASGPNREVERDTVLISLRNRS